MADLTNMGKMYSLLNILTDVLQSIVFFDYAIDQKKLSKRELSQYLVLGNPVYWETMSKYQLTRNRSRLNDLLTSHSKQHLKPLLNGLLIEGWNGLFTGYPEAENLQPFHQLSESHNRHKNATFSHLEYIGEKVAGKNSNKLQENEQEIKGTTLLNISKEYENIYSAKNAQKQSYCKSCGRDVSDQRPGSLFCSERIYGRIAKACRNKNSNRRRDLKRIISKAMSIQNFIAVTYQIGIQTYTDTLHPSELDVTKKWLDRITRIDILPTARGEKPETLMGNKAKEYVQSITNKKQ
jgi:hypothetical protein